MVDVKTRAQNILRALPLSQKQRDLYQRGVAAMDEATLERTTSKLESALAQVPEALATVRELLADQQAQSLKHAVIFVEDDAYRQSLKQSLTRILGRHLKIDIPKEPKEVIAMIGTACAVVICDFKIMSMKDVDPFREMRRAAMVALEPFCPIFVRTTNPEEDGQVAAAGATGYRASNTAAELTRAVTSAIKANASLSDQL